jgi:hypothetical protein
VASHLFHLWGVAALMAFTTLTTFFLYVQTSVLSSLADKYHRKTAHDVVSVELLGSWDNFGKPYVMERDRKLGRGNWRGCHSFAGIICDGDAVNPPESRRDGGLLQGGTYWYYVSVPPTYRSHRVI